MSFDALRQYFAIAGAVLAQERAQPDKPPRSRDELAFLPAALEIVETPPAPLGRAVLWAVLLLLTTALCWAIVSPLDIHATARGKIIPSSKTKLVQPAEPGVVKEIRVRDGQQVEEGELVILLDQTTAAADVQRLSRELQESRVSKARLRALLDDRDRLEPPAGAPEGAVRVHQMQLQARLQEHRAQVNGLLSDVEQKQAERNALRADLAGLKESQPLLREVVAMRSELERSGSGSKLQLLQARESLIDKTQTLKSTESRILQAEAAIDALTGRIVQATEQFRAEALRDLAEAERQEETLGSELAKAAQRLKQMELRAPVAGVVQQLAVHAPGAVVTQAQGLLAVVPLGDRIEAEVLLPNKDVGFVGKDQEVEIKIDAFPFTRYGTLPGRVTTVSYDAVQDGQGGRGGAAEETAYVLRVEMPSSILVDRREVPLTPGMAVTAEIKTGTRLVIEYLLAPLLRYRDESGRER